MNSKHVRHFGKAILALLILVGIPVHAKKPSPPVSGLFLPVPRPVIAKDKDLKNEEKRIKNNPAIRRNQFVEIDTALLSNLALQGDSAIGTTLLLNFFPDAFLMVILEQIETRQGYLTLQGRVEGSAASTVLLTVQDGIVSGTVSLLTGQFQVLPVRNRYHAVQEVDPQALPPELQPLVPNISAASESLLFAPEIAAAEAPVIDVLVLYTTAAAAAAGGSDKIVIQIAMAERQMNESLRRGQASPRVKVVATKEISYAESGSLATDLVRLQRAEGAFAGVPALRDEWGADLVSLLVSGANLGCGIAYVMVNPNIVFAPYAYSTVVQGCATSSFTFAHELGHNFGCEHDRANADGPGAFSYSYGYQAPGVFRTIMAYNNGCNCPRVLSFSNPGVFIDGGPAGVPLGQPNEAHNALTIENTGPILAAFRPSRVGFGAYDVNSAYGFDAGYASFRGMADVNGDGKEDYCRLVGNAPNIHLSCAVANHEGGFGNYDVNSALLFDAGYPASVMFRGLADANGDGRADYCRFVGLAPNIYLSCAFGGGGGGGFGDRDFNSAPSLDRGYDTFRGMADVNGDGRADYCRFVGNAPDIFLSCALATASGFGNYDFNSAPGFDAGFAFRGMADVNGDGRADYCRFVGNVPNTYLSCALATDHGFGNYDFNSSTGYDGGHAFFRALKDVNDDGRADYCRFVGDFPNVTLSCGLAEESGFGTQKVNSTQGYDIGYDGAFRGMADVNGDGKGDYCRFVGNAPNIFLSCGTAR
ncbi:MAG TPA: M12 family metallo-peptidase [Thermoanaerobaculia bacterium]|jgi:hypothetical protein|nr:M12 family metallo-peptidase [Thermoanaerobaculia bacterium]